ncbi:MAG: hypothetical protein K0S28_249, partial [Paucimonas sp.]|nr:hypothetical protein [Paucimonas sp.]
MRSSPKRLRLIAVAAWLACVMVTLLIVGQARFTADLSAFLPEAPTQEQRVLLDQVRDGVVSRLILVGIEGGEADQRANISKAMARQLREDAAFASVNNGEPVHAERDRAYLFNNRYLLSPAVTAERYAGEGLRNSISEAIDMLASPAGMMLKSMLPRDPTAETVHLFEQMGSANRPLTSQGVWTSRNGQRALMVIETRAPSGDTDAQQAAIQRIETVFDQARMTSPQPAAELKLVMTGPGVFAVQSRATIEGEVTRLSLTGVAIIVIMLLLVYRSPTVLVLGLMPVVSGALVGVAAVSLGFGVVHGITLGFGTTLIGEAVDYSIYLFIQSRQLAAGSGDAASRQEWIRRFWPTIRLGVLTSIAGFCALLFSDFPGLAQLGLYSISGLLAAAAITRFVLPYLLPAGFRVRDISAIGRCFAAVAMRLQKWRVAVLILVLAACAVIIANRNTLLNTEVSSLSPVPPEAQAADAALRADLGAPDARNMVIVSAPTGELALQAAEKVASQLQHLVERGVLAGFETPSRYLPSIAAQRSRQESLPGDDAGQRVRKAVEGLPLRAETLAPFLQDMAEARMRAPLTRADLDNTSFALAVDSLLFNRGSDWVAMLPLTAPGVGGTIDEAEVRKALSESRVDNALFVDLKVELD